MQEEIVLNVGKKGEGLQSVLLLNPDLFQITSSEDWQIEKQLDEKTREAVETLNSEYSDIVLLKRRRYRIKFRAVVSKTLTQDTKQPKHIHQEHNSRNNSYRGRKNQRRRNRQKQKGTF